MHRTFTLQDPCGKFNILNIDHSHAYFCRYNYGYYNIIDYLTKKNNAKNICQGAFHSNYGTINLFGNIYIFNRNTRQFISVTVY